MKALIAILAAVIVIAIAVRYGGGNEKTVSQKEFQETTERLRAQIDSVMRNTDSLKTELQKVRANTDTLKAGQQVIYQTMQENTAKYSIFDAIKQMFVND